MHESECLKTPASDTSFPIDLDRGALSMPASGSPSSLPSRTNLTTGSWKNSANWMVTGSRLPSATCRGGNHLLFRVHDHGVADRGDLHVGLSKTASHPGCRLPKPGIR